jgi:hypothetical protein
VRTCANASHPYHRLTPKRGTEANVVQHFALFGEAGLRAVGLSPARLRRSKGKAVPAPHVAPDAVQLGWKEAIPTRRRALWIRTVIVRRETYRCCSADCLRHVAREAEGPTEKE